MMACEHRYRFDPTGHIWGAATGVGQPIATTSLDGVRTATCLGPFGSPERDLLRVMSAVLAADRLSTRQPPGAKRAYRELRWQRQLHVHVAVEFPDRWVNAAPALQELLSFMTDDAWHLEFEPIAEKPALQQQVLTPFAPEGIDEIALFSGGLDSAAGAFVRGNEGNRALLAVSACGNQVRGAAQRVTLKTLQSRGIRIAWLRFNHQIRHARRTRGEMEVTQRSRALLFLAMGATAASHLGLPTFSVYETGVGCINLPTSSAQVGAQGTRAMHPRTLSLFNQLLPTVLERRVRVVAPFFLHTKAELCRLAGPCLAQLARVTMSCDEGEGHKPDGMLHCGLCTSCIFRRVALYSSGLAPDPTAYRDIATRMHGTYEIISFENHAATLSSCRSFSDLVDIDPDARYAVALPLHHELDQAGAAAAILQMYQRYAVEVQAYLNQARPAVSNNPLLPKTERSRGLFSATG
jgi:7-cyano-7-deazaguanine synthase in queuosine biosynthesis